MTFSQLVDLGAMSTYVWVSSFLNNHCWSRAIIFFFFSYTFVFSAQWWMTRFAINNTAPQRRNYCIVFDGAPPQPAEASFNCWDVQGTTVSACGNHKKKQSLWKLSGKLETELCTHGGSQTFFWLVGPICVLGNWSKINRKRAAIKNNVYTRPMIK